MAFAACWKALVEVTFVDKEVEELRPKLSTFLRVSEGLFIPYHDACIPGTRQEDVDSFRRKHEPDVIRGITTSQRDDHYPALFALVVIYVVLVWQLW